MQQLLQPLVVLSDARDSNSCESCCENFHLLARSIATTAMMTHSFSRLRNVAAVASTALDSGLPSHNGALRSLSISQVANKSISTCAQIRRFAPGARLMHTLMSSKRTTMMTDSEVPAQVTNGQFESVKANSGNSKSPFLLAPEERTVTNVKTGPGPGYGQTKLGRPTTGALEVDGFSIEGVSVGGQETCVMLPALKVAFDIGRCPKRAVDQDFLFITHAHMDHIGGLTMYIASRGLLKRKVPTVIVPKCVKTAVENLFAVQRQLDDSELPVNLIGMDIGEEFDLGKGFIVKAFKTYHVVPSQGYVIYSVKQKLKAEYRGIPGKQIQALKASGVQVTETVRTPEAAFTGDTTMNFFLDEANKDILNAKLLIMESTFLDAYMSEENATEYGHTHLFQILAHAEMFKNKNIVLIHFSARYTQEDIFEAIKKIPPPLQGRVFALTEGF